MIHAAVAFVVAVVAVARATRLATSDAYPPAVWLRMRWVNATGARKRTQDWSPLMECPFCFAPYAAAVDLAWALASTAWAGHVGWSWAGAWWVANLWAAGSYLASMIVVRDEPPAEG